MSWNLLVLPLDILAWMMVVGIVLTIVAKITDEIVS
jgi:hypothetical protein